MLACSQWDDEWCEYLSHLPDGVHIYFIRAIDGDAEEISGIIQSPSRGKAKSYFARTREIEYLWITSCRVVTRGCDAYITEIEVA